MLRNIKKKYTFEGIDKSGVKWRVSVLAVVLMYMYLMYVFIGVRPDHFFLCTLVLVFVFFGKGWGRMFLVDWSPFIIFWVAYDSMRGIANTVRDYIFVFEPYNLEVILFGWMTSSTVPAFYLQIFQMAHEDALVKIALDIFTTSTYLMHFMTPLLLGWIFWHTLNERRTYYLFIYTFTTLNFMALLTFMIYPAAPPWYVYSYGFDQPQLTAYDSSASLINFDRLIGSNFLQSLWNTFNPNHFAAIPSLHSGYPTVIALFIWLRFKGWTWLFVLYPLGAWFSAVYLNHHYIIDLIIGSIYVFIAYFIAKKLILPYIFDRIIDYNLSTKILSNKKAAEE